MVGVTKNNKKEASELKEIKYVKKILQDLIFSELKSSMTCDDL